MDALDPAELPRPRSGGAGRVLDERQLAALIRHAKPHYRPAMVTLAYSGMRISECLGLRWSCVDFVEEELRVRGQLDRPRRGQAGRFVELLKSDAGYRDVPMFPAVAAALTDRLGVELGSRAGP